MTRDVEVLADVLGGLTHGLQAVCGVLVGVDDVVDEGAGKTVTTVGHGLGTDGDTDLDSTGHDLVGNVLCGLETGAAEAVGRVCGGGVGEAGSETGGADVVGGFGIGYIAQTDVLYHLRVDS